MLTTSFKSLNQSQKVSVKSDEIISAVISEKVTLGNVDIEIIDIERIDGGVQVFARAWQDGEQIGFGADGTVDIERFRIFNPPVLVLDENGPIVKTIDSPEGLRADLSVTLRYREDPKQALLEVIAHTISVVKNKVVGSSSIEPGKRGNTTSTFYPTMDGYARYNSTGVNWATIIAAAGNQTNTAATNLAWQLSGAVSGTGGSTLLDVLARYVMVFDTSSIPDGDTISSATFSGYCTSTLDEFSVEPTMTIMGATLASDASIANGDYASTFTDHQTAFATAKTFADFTTSAYNDFVLNAAGIAAISKTGNSRFSLRFAEDITGGTSPQQATAAREFAINISSVDETGTAQDPKLVVEHSAPASTFVPRITWFM